MEERPVSRSGDEAGKIAHRAGSKAFHHEGSKERKHGKSPVLRFLAKSRPHGLGKFSPGLGGTRKLLSGNVLRITLPPARRTSRKWGLYNNLRGLSAQSVVVIGFGTIFRKSFCGDPRKQLPFRRGAFL
jgi:hypothetical protein